MVTLINSENNLYQLFATIGFRRLLSFEENPPLQQVIDSNLVPKFISFIKRADDTKLQFEAAWCLTNIASGEHDHVQVLIEKGAVGVLVNLLSSPHIEVIEQAIWALGNIAGDNTRIRDMVIMAGAVTPIAEALDRTPAGSCFVRNASWTLSNFCRGRPGPEFNLIKRGIPSLAKVLIENDQEEILTDICWALSYISDGGVDRIPFIIETNVLPRLIQLLEHPHIAISVACLRTIGNILTGDDAETQYALEQGTLEALNRLISHNRKAVRKEVCWSVSNITAGNANQIQLCLDCGIIDKLIHLMQHDDNDIRKEALWAVSNTTAMATPAQFLELVQKGILNALCGIMTFSEPRLLLVAIEGVENVLKAGKAHFGKPECENPFVLVVEEVGGIDKIEQL